MPFDLAKMGVSFSRPLFNFREVKALYEGASVGRSTAKQIELLAAKIVSQDFPGPASHKFMEKVIGWGKGYRFRDRAMAENAPEDVARVLRSAHANILQNDFAGAVDTVAELRYVGHSFASKHVRMMCPDKAATLDSRIRNRLGYPEDSVGYRAFLSDLEQLKALMLESDQVPQEILTELRVCDVEMIVYAALENK